MTLLIISHMHDVMLHLVKDNPHISKVYLANLSLADKLYYGHLFEKHGIAYEDIAYKRYSKDLRMKVYPLVAPLITQSIEYLRLSAGTDMTKIIDHYANLFLNFDTFFKEHTIDATCTWNGQRVFDLIINYHAKHHHLKTIYYEMGLFRPDTLTIDPKGVNIHNSVPREPDFYKNYIPKKSLQVPEKNSIPSSSENVYKVYKTFDHLLALLNYKSYKRFDNLYKLSSPAPSSTDQTITLKHLDSSYLNIFCPLQVSHDTQILLNSPNIKSMDAFLDLIHQTSITFSAQKKKVRFYIKAHPLEKRVLANYLNSTIFVLDATVSSTDAVEKMDVTLTINSTVGLEAIEQNRPCITLAETFYSIKPIAFYTQPEQLIATIETAINESDAALQKQFIHYLKDEYQLHYNPFDILTYTPQEHHNRFMELVNAK